MSVPKGLFGSLSQRQCADMHGVDVRTIRRWDEDGHPKQDDGTYIASESIAWRLQRETGSDLDLNAERARLAKAQADKTEIENAHRAGTLLDQSQVLREVGDMLGAFRSRVIAIPDAIGQLFDSRTAPKVIGEVRRKLHEALAELAEYRPSLPRRAGEDVAASADPDGERVGGHQAPAVNGKQCRVGSVED